MAENDWNIRNIGATRIVDLSDEAAPVDGRTVVARVDDDDKAFGASGATRVVVSPSEPALTRVARVANADSTRVAAAAGGSAATRVAKGDASATRVASAADGALMLEPEVVSFTDSEGNAYRIDLGSVVGVGGQAVVVDATDDSGRSLVAKISEPLNWSTRRAYEGVIREVMELSHKSLSSTHLMPVLTYMRGGIEARLLGDTQPRRFDIAILPKGVCLGEQVLEPAFVRDRVIPELACAIHTLQQRGIVHSDVKPLNLFLVDGQVVLGDYGAARSLEGMDYRNTMTSRVSVGYTAADRIVAPANDWYSFGYTVWTMYDANVHPLHAFISAPGGLDAIHQGFDSVSFVPREAGDEPLGNLLKGLTIEDAANRFGYDEVMEWVADPAGFSKAPVNVGRQVRPYEMNGVYYTDPRRLAQALAKDWSGARQRLYQLEGWLHDAGYNDLETEVHILTEEDEVISGNADLCLACVICAMSNGALWCWYGRDVSLATLTSSAEGDAAETEESLLPLLRSGFLGWALRRGAKGNAGALDMASSLDEIRNLAQKSPHFAYLLFLGCLAETSDAHAYAQGLISSLLSQPLLFAFTISGRPSCETWLSKLACSISPRSLVEAREAIIDAEGTVDADQLLLFLERIGDDKQTVRTFYLSYGAGAPWLWVARHAEQYEILPDIPESRREKDDTVGPFSRENPEKTETLGSALSRLARLAATSDYSLHELIEASSTAHTICTRLRTNMRQTPVPYLHGWYTGLPVTPRTSDALFCSSLRGELVPRGYVRELLARMPQSDSQSVLESFHIELLADTSALSSRQYRRFLSNEKTANTASLETLVDKLRKNYSLDAGGSTGLLLTSAGIMIEYALIASVMASGFAGAIVAFGIPVVLLFIALIGCMLVFLASNFQRHSRVNASISRLQRRLDGNDQRLQALYDVLAAFDQRTGEDAGNLASPAFARMLPPSIPLPFSDDTSGVSDVERANKSLDRLAVYGWRSAFALMSIGSLFYFFDEKMFAPDAWTAISLLLAVLALLWVLFVFLKPDRNPCSTKALISWLWLPVIPPALICWLCGSFIASLLSAIPVILALLVILFIVFGLLM